MNAIEKKQFNKELMTLAIPLALQNLLRALVGASDALMLGRLTQDAIAAVSLANQISFVQWQRPTSAPNLRRVLVCIR